MFYASGTKIKRSRQLEMFSAGFFSVLGFCLMVGSPSGGCSVGLSSNVANTEDPSVSCLQITLAITKRKNLTINRITSLCGFHVAVYEWKSRLTNLGAVMEKVKPLNVPVSFLSGRRREQEPQGVSVVWGSPSCRGAAPGSAMVNAAASEF